MSEELSINNLFIKNNSGNAPRLLTNSSFNVFDVKSSYDKPEFDDYVIKKIKVVNKETEEKVKEVYNTKYIECMHSINCAIDIGLSQAIYFVPFHNNGLKKYNHKDCIKYIIKKLKEKGLEAYETLNTIYINWSHI